MNDTNNFINEISGGKTQLLLQKLHRYQMGLSDGFGKAPDTLSFGIVTRLDKDPDYLRGLDIGRQLYKLAIETEKERLGWGEEVTIKKA